MSTAAGRAWWILLLVGAVGLIAYGVMPNAIAEDIVYLLLVSACTIAVAVGVHLHQPVLRRPWHWMVAGLLCWVVGDAIYVWLEDIAGVEPFPTVADAFYLAGYPMLAYGLHLLVRARHRRADRASFLDSLIVTSGLGLLLWVLVIAPTITTDQGSPVGSLIAVAYPVGDIVLIAGAVRLFATAGGQTASLRLLITALVSVIVADASYAVIELFGLGGERLLDNLWLASFMLWGAAALHPSMTQLSRPGVTRQQTFTNRRLAAMALAVLVAPVTLLFANASGLSTAVLGAVLGSGIVFLLVLARMKVAIDQMTTLNAQHIILQEELSFQASHDTLTELPNRPQLMLRLRLALGQARTLGTTVGVLYVDLDGFKAVNDTLGHQAGDSVLCAVALRLSGELRGLDIAARLGGDEFVVLLEGDTDLEAAEKVAERLITSLSRPYQLGTGEEVVIGASVGIAIGGRGKMNAEALLREADASLYLAKTSGKGRAASIGQQPDAEDPRRPVYHDLDAATALERAIAADELSVLYQPVVELPKGRILGFEALVRWQRGNGATVQPDDFIPLAEASDLIRTLDNWVLDVAVRQLARWSTVDAMRDVNIAVNISGRHINDPALLSDVLDLVEHHQIDPNRLVLEVTETVPVEDGEPIAVLHLLRNHGVRISLDDFGTGYNTIDSLRRIPLDVVKIDRTFIDSGSPARAKLLPLLVRAARAYDLPIVAEGVEGEEQRELVSNLGLDMAQGFYFGKPGTAAEAQARVAASARGRSTSLRLPRSRRPGLPDSQARGR